MRHDQRAGIVIAFSGREVRSWQELKGHEDWE